MANLLPPPSPNGVYRFPDGSLIRRGILGKWVAYWADRTPLRDADDMLSRFSTAEEAAEALAAGGEGPGRKGLSIAARDAIINELTMEQLRQFAKSVHNDLFLEVEDGVERLDRDAQWSPDNIERVFSSVEMLDQRLVDWTN